LKAAKPRTTTPDGYQIDTGEDWHTKRFPQCYVPRLELILRIHSRARTQLLLERHRLPHI
jgi:hypothetical protein